ncbi:unnamed protein product, partial [Ectocarpus fasciculatus]
AVALVGGLLLGLEHGAEIPAVDEAELGQPAGADVQGDEQGPNLAGAELDATGDEGLPLLLVVLHAHQFHAGGDRFGEILVVLAVTKRSLRYLGGVGGFGLHASQQRLGSKSLLHEAVRVKLEERQCLDELRRGHRGHTVVLAQVTGGGLVQLFFGVEQPRRLK